MTGETDSSGYVAATPETDAQLQYALGLLSGRLIQPAPGTRQRSPPPHSGYRRVHRDRTR